MLREEVEMCSNCMGENIIQWDVEKDGYKTKCEHCGEDLMLCDACFHSDDNPEHRCDWTEENGCFRGKDYKVEQLWHELTDVLFTETEDGSLVLDSKWYIFEAGTDRDDIWHWFDKNHSKGVYWLLYEDSKVEDADTIEKYETKSDLLMENAIEITWMFDKLMKTGEIKHWDDMVDEFGSSGFKNEIMSIARDFENAYPPEVWEDTGCDDYVIEIEKFARKELIKVFGT